MNKVFQVGDKVRRIDFSNGYDGARIGQVATVVRVEEDANGDGWPHVVYPGNWNDVDGAEVWCPAFAEKMPDNS